MKYKSRLITFITVSIVSLCMLLAFTACGDNGEQPEETKATEPSTEKTEATSSPAGFSLSEGLSLTEDGDNAILKGNGFSLTMPNTGTWSYKCDGARDTIEIYYMPADEAGYGGTLFTLFALDKGDSSYKELPDYKVAGESSTYGKLFVAAFPTDVQFDMNDSTQEAEYTELLEYVNTISDKGSGPLKIK